MLTAMVRRNLGSRPVTIAALLLTASCAWIAFVLSIGSIAERKSHPSVIEQRRIVHRPKNSTVDSELQSIVFGIAGSSGLWPRRREFVRLWWRPDAMRGFVWLEREPDREGEAIDGLPEIRVSENTLERLRDPIRGGALGHPNGVRIARIVLETFQLGLPGSIKWFVFCDDDTVFSVENLVRVLAKYDPSQLVYIGATSESHAQNVAFSYDMAFGGAGFAISYPLAEAIAGIQDECLQHYPQLIGSDDRLRACIAELGVPLTREIGFHQCDVRGNAMGLLAAHPVAPFVSIHHLEFVDLFPNVDALQGARALARSMHLHGPGFLQQAICYDRQRRLTFSISSGYVVQVFPEIVFPKVLQKAEITFSAWNHKRHSREFDLDSRNSFWICKQPFLFFADAQERDPEGRIESYYQRYTSSKMMCWSQAKLPGMIRVVAQPLHSDWYKAPRRQCCQIGDWDDGETVKVNMTNCRPGESIVPF
ncbi:uncharacterized protein LOC112343564 [Selaginella moellendorffii]|uniref:uncharacterized protein LOC112343564 n=1 Tax=Selaginella moellendorffii TaxID=88036 RepID=UPI000D1C8AA7|nr:uncharacterized protein LOC112343564 [Selaginella moellendorffii]|eukprot:XP_024523008.1 uncharacterized protein LOC112343564 [Selaginella moellendorffii]